MQELLYCATLASRKPKNTVWWAQTFQEQGQVCMPFCAQKQEPETVSGIGIFLVGASRLLLAKRKSRYSRLQKCTMGLNCFPM